MAHHEPVGGAREATIGDEADAPTPGGVGGVGALAGVAVGGVRALHVRPVLARAVGLRRVAQPEVRERGHSIPEVLAVAAARRPDGPADQIIRLIEADPALTSRVLGLCRGAGLGLGERITTARRAVLMLGLDSVQSAVLGVAVYEVIHREQKAVF